MAVLEHLDHKRAAPAPATLITAQLHLVESSATNKSSCNECNYKKKNHPVEVRTVQLEISSPVESSSTFQVTM